MARETVFPRTPTLDRFLALGESTGDIETNDDYGYQIVGIYGNGKSPADSVLLVMPDRDCMVEPATLVGPKKLTITPLSGRGKIIVARAGRGVEVYRDGEVVVLEIGDTYGYVNLGDEPYILRDDCSPAFHPIDEIALMSERDREIPEAFLAEYSKE